MVLHADALLWIEIRISNNVFPRRVRAVVIREHAYGTDLVRTAKVDRNAVVHGVENGAVPARHADGVARAGSVAVVVFERAYPGAFGHGG